MQPQIEADLLEFVHVVGSPIDNATRLLRLHGLAEYFLERIIRRRIADGALLTDDERFSFYHKLQVAVALGELNSKTVGALRKLAKVRNRCAHERKPIVTAEEIADVGRILNPLYERAWTDLDGEDREFRALAWALFTELSDQTTARELVFEALKIRRSDGS